MTNKQNSPMTLEAAARIQSQEAKQGGGQVQKDSFTARAQRAAEHNQKTNK